jgi:hypothetical protein
MGQMWPRPGLYFASTGIGIAWNWYGLAWAWVRLATSGLGMFWPVHGVG